MSKVEINRVESRLERYAALFLAVGNIHYKVSNPNTFAELL